MNYLRIYNNIINYRLENEYVGYTERHHILPKCLGGTNDKENLVNLSAREHFICHLLLTKIYIKGSNEYYKMCHAFLMMLIGGKDHIRYNGIVTSNLYSELKVARSKNMSKMSEGSKNSRYNTAWFYNVDLQICKSVNIETNLGDGWLPGRVIDWDKFNNKELILISKQEDINKNNDIKLKNRQLKLEQKKFDILKRREARKENTRKLKLEQKKFINENKPIKPINTLSKHYLKKIELDNIDWDMLYSLYTAYGFDIASHLTGWTKSRESMLMQFKNRVTNYAPSQKMKKIWDENYSKG